MAEPRELLEALAGNADPGQLAHVHHRAAVDPTYGDWPRWVPPAVDAAVRGSGITQLWSHQSLTAELLWAGEHVALSTGTASGKSLGYLLPLLSAAHDGASAINGRGATAIYLAPTKALAADQLTRIEALAIPGIRAAALDGDTPYDERRWIREHANVVLTNPDLLHHTLLPGHERWAPFLRRMRYVVVDESHVYRGVLGSHVAAVLRRLRRISARYAADPVFVLASATMADPGRHASDLLGLPVRPVTQDGSARGAATYAFWRPGARADGEGPVSAVAEAGRLMRQLVAADIQTVTFARSRVGVEVVADLVRRSLDVGPDQVAAYRGGYLPEERRALEAGLRARTLTGIAATNALELGVDISGLDAVVMAGWPGTRASFWQQAGRAGRRGGAALVLLVAGDDPLDRYLLDHPAAVLGAPVERAVLDPANPQVLMPHLLAAAAELPLTPDDETYFGSGMVPLLDSLVERRLLRRRPKGWFWADEGRPTDLFGLRGTGEQAVRIVESRTGRVLGTVDGDRSHGAVHEGAVYVHQGEAHVVTRLDLQDGSAHVVRGDPGWSTQARSVSAFDVLTVDETQSFPVAQLCFGTVQVREQVTSFLRRLPSGEVIGEHGLDLPERSMTTRAVWWTAALDPLLDTGLTLGDLPGALHAAEHASIALLPLIAQSDRWDVGGVSTILHPDTELPTVLVYDGHPGGAGFARRAFDRGAEWLTATRAAILACECAEGCPGCVHSPKCGNGNQPLDKAGAVQVLDLVLGHGGLTRRE